MYSKMSVNMTSQTEIRRSLRQVLLATWDPVGVGDNPNLADEYDGYLSRLEDLAALTEGVDAVELELKRIEEMLGMSSDPALRFRTAEDVVEIVTKGNKKTGT